MSKKKEFLRNLKLKQSGSHCKEKIAAVIAMIFSLLIPVELYSRTFVQRTKENMTNVSLVFWRRVPNYRHVKFMYHCCYDLTWTEYKFISESLSKSVPEQMGPWQSIAASLTKKWILWQPTIASEHKVTLLLYMNKSRNYFQLLHKKNCRE